jgi:uroporphyrinogen decarboxylase
MTSRERVAAALACREPDRVPYCEIHVDQQIAEQLLGRELPPAPTLESNPRGLEDEIALAQALGKDNICFVMRAPVYTERTTAGGETAFYTDGLIRSEADLALLDLPDPDDEGLWAEAERWTRGKGDYSLWLITRLGLFPTMLSMGMERFFIAVHENLGFVERLLDRYCDWSAAVLRRACQLDFDVICSTDDFAGKHGPMFSPAFFHDIVMPRFRKIAENVTKPWVHHSDGNVMPILDDLLSLGICGLHPNEKGAMDIRQMKREYGETLCLLGNVDLNLLMLATPEEVEEEVRGLIQDVAPGGGYIVTSGNSLTYYCRLGNIMAMSQAVSKYGGYPL